MLSPYYMPSPFLIRSFPRAIVHIDADTFFASCEQSRNPSLKGKPVICGKERGIAASMSREAKARGITRAMPLAEIRRLCPDAVILPSDYETYSLLSQRFFSIVRRFTPEVEEYGIDECFADLTGLRALFRTGYREIVLLIQHELEQELGISFSIGLAPTKSLAKIGSKWQKPHGFTTISGREIHQFLEKLPIDEVWGIGPQTTAFLLKQGKQTALEFARTPEGWIANNLSRNFLDIWHELNGRAVMRFSTTSKTDYASIQKFKTFTPPSTEPDFIFSQLSKNIENACIKARRHTLAAHEVSVVLRTQDFRHFTVEVQLSRPTNVPTEILPIARQAFAKIFKPGILYRGTGITLFKLQTPSQQLDLFNSLVKAEKFTKIYAAADKISEKYGKHSVFLGSSWKAHTLNRPTPAHGIIPERHTQKLLGESTRKRLGIPMFLGNIS